MQISQIYCSHCGAANEKTSTLCFACSSSLSQEVETPESAAVLLNQRYRVLTSVGIGGFGTIYKVQDIQRANALFAVKQINLTDLSATQIIAATEAFHREVRMLSSLQHENLPQIYDSFTDPHHWYMVMDFIEGETLEQYLAVKGMAPRSPGTPFMPIKEIISIGLQLCAVLGYLHKQQPAIIFRDLKPSNIMYTAQGHLFLIDFGIARQFKPGKAKDTLPLGSPGYAAPEQYGRAQTTPRADIYSFGVLLHQFLSGDDPSEHSFQFAPLRMYGGSDLTDLDKLIQRMVDTHPERRPTIDEVKMLFQRLQTRYQLQPSLPANIISGSQLPVSGTPTYPLPSIQQQQQVLFPPPNKMPGQQRSRRRFIQLGVGAAVVFSGGWLASSWLSHANTQNATNVVTSVNTSPTLLWTFPTGSSIDSFFSPTIVNEVIYIGSNDENLYAIDARTGQKKWAYQTGGVVYISPAVVNKVVYIGSNDGNLYAIDAPTGQKKWACQTGSAAYASPVVINGAVYVGSNDGNLYAIDAPTGQKKWACQTGAAVSSLLVVARGIVYACLSDGSLLAIDAIAGQKKWSFTTTTTITTTTGISTSTTPGTSTSTTVSTSTGGITISTTTSTFSILLTVADDVVYVSSSDGNLYALDATTGRKKWTFSTNDSPTSPIVANGIVYLGTFNKDLYAIDAVTGQRKWSFRVGGMGNSLPTIVDGVVYVGSYDGNLYALDAVTGKQQWSFQAGDAVSTPTLVDGVIYIGSYDNNVYAVDAVTGKQQWSLLTKGPIDSTPTVAAGVIYVGADDNNLYAIAPPA